MMMERAMFPLLSGLISGGASLLGSIFSSDTSAQNTQAQIAGQEAMQGQTEQFNAQQAQLNRDFQASQVQSQEQFQQQMSGTAYQRASADMKAAGLNPAMMFGSGSAASSPVGSAASGSTASVGTPSVPMPQNRSPLAGLGDAVQSGLSAMVTAKTFDKLGEEIANLNASNTVLKNEGTLIGNKAAQAGYGVTTAAAEAERAQRYIDMPSWFKNAVEYGKYGASGIGSVGDAISSFVPTAKGVRSLLADPGNPTAKYTGLGPSGTQTVKDMIDDAMSSLK